MNEDKDTHKWSTNIWFPCTLLSVSFMILSLYFMLLVAKDCRDGSFSDRNGVVKAIRQGFRVEGKNTSKNENNL